MRKVSQQELSVIGSLLDRDVPGAEVLRSQLPDSLVYPMNEDETILRFKVSSHAAPASLPYKQNVAVEAVTKDLDGCRVEVLLHVKDGLVYELEYVKVDGSPLQKRPTGGDLAEFVVHR
jgi:hypothetical protein